LNDRQFVAGQIFLATPTCLFKRLNILVAKLPAFRSLALFCQCESASDLGVSRIHDASRFWYFVDGIAHMCAI
jgi:hypothetical protein